MNLPLNVVMLAAFFLASWASASCLNWLALREWRRTVREHWTIRAIAAHRVRLVAFGGATIVPTEIVLATQLFFPDLAVSPALALIPGCLGGYGPGNRPLPVYSRRRRRSNGWGFGSDRSGA